MPVKTPYYKRKSVRFDVPRASVDPVPTATFVTLSNGNLLLSTWLKHRDWPVVYSAITEGTIPDEDLKEIERIVSIVNMASKPLLEDMVYTPTKETKPRKIERQWLYELSAYDHCCALARLGLLKWRLAKVTIECAMERFIQALIYDEALHPPDWKENEARITAAACLVAPETALQERSEDTMRLRCGFEHWRTDQLPIFGVEGFHMAVDHVNAATRAAAESRFKDGYSEAHKGLYRLTCFSIILSLNPGPAINGRVETQCESAHMALLKCCLGMHPPAIAEARRAAWNVRKHHMRARLARRTLSLELMRTWDAMCELDMHLRTILDADRALKRQFPSNQPVDTS